MSALIFDLDGTLVDSIADLCEALNHAHRALSLRDLHPDEVRAMVGDGAATLVARALEAAGGAPTLQERALELFMRAYVSAPGERAAVYPGVAETLALLASRGLAMGVCTNKPARPAADLLAQLGLAGFFTSLVGGDTLPERKPHPAPARLSLAELGVSADKAVFIGDSHVDVATARAAGLRAIAVSYGYARGPAEALGADALIHAFAELPQALDGLAS